MVHHGAGGWTALLVDDLGVVDDEALRARPLPPFPKIALWLPRDGRQFEAVLGHLAAWAAEIRELARRDPTQEDWAVVARYILRVAGEIPSQALRERIAHAAPELEEPMATVEEQLIQQGVRQGVEQGMRQGVEQGMRQGRTQAPP